MPDVFRSPSRLPLIAASILSADFARMGAECRGVLSGGAGGDAGADGADVLHLDVMDGRFVPNLTLGPDMCRALRRAIPDAPLDVHLMVTDPQNFVDAFADAGADNFTFHIEPAIGIYRSQGRPEGPPRYNALSLADRVRARGMTAGIALNPLTHPDALLDLLPAFDAVLVMSVHPGHSGQAFLEATLQTARAIRGMLRDDQRLAMDGGISPENAQRVRQGGCDVLVAASAIFGRPEKDRTGVIRTLRGVIEHASRPSR